MIYFIGATGLNVVKIGHTEAPDRRFAALQIGSPVILVRMGLMYGDKDQESVIHMRFRASRKHGEWFAFGDEMYDFLLHNGLVWIAPDPSQR